MPNATESGFTLIEVLVALGVFIVLSTLAVGSLVNIAGSHDATRNLKLAMNNLNYSLESMSRHIRFARYYDCGVSQSRASNMNNCDTGASSIQIKFQGDDVRYRHQGGEIQRCEGDDCASGNWEPITSPEVTIHDLQFYVFGAGTSTPSNTVHPRVLVTIDGEAGSEASRFKLQTTINQRARE